MQKILNNKRIIEELQDIVDKNEASSIMLVCGRSFWDQEMYVAIRKLSRLYNWCEFFDFTPNPSYESIVKGIHVFQDKKCDFIIAAGGGSAIDVAKCIKLFSGMDQSENYLEQEIIENNVPILAIPTTAGTGSEATKFAVIYLNGDKLSISHDSIIPQYVILDPTNINSLPLYQRKVTIMDAFCHALESFWSVNSTEKSRKYSKFVIKSILENYKEYMSGNATNTEILEAAFYAGKAINITQTTAGHAMSYKITSLYHIPHGHAVALCVEKVWGYMLHNLDKCIDPRGESFLVEIFDQIAESMSCRTAEEALNKFSRILTELNLTAPLLRDEEELESLAHSVNPIRLRNNPVLLDKKALYGLYVKIFKEREV